MAAVGSAAGAAGYYAKDNYYTDRDASEASEWTGAGAALAGLSGVVDEQAFKAALEGVLPDGSEIAAARNGAQRPGLDLTFSAPKSVSLLAYIGGDERLLAAQLNAVRTTIAWAEKNFAETRISRDGKQTVVKTGTLLAALFQHDTSRNLDPQLHTHAIVANVTRDADGKWRALRNDKLWSYNTVLGSVYHAQLRADIEALGYTTVPVGKHGTFEIEGVSREGVEAFSTRHAEIIAAGRNVLDYQSPQGLREVTLRTRGDKPIVEDRDALRADWKRRAHAAGLDLRSVVDAAREVAEFQPITTIWERVTGGLRDVLDRTTAVIGYVRDRVGLSRPEIDPHMPDKTTTLSPLELGAATAVASAIRQLSERETSFDRFELAKSALDLGLPVTIADVEKAVARLLRDDKLIAGVNGRADQVTTPEAVQTEHRILAGVDAGRGAVVPIVASPAEAGERLQSLAVERLGFALNSGQESAGRLLLAASDRAVVVQGIAGAGKSSTLGVVAEVTRSQGHNVLALGPQNKLVRDLERDSGIASMTIAKFLYTHQRLLSPRTFVERIDAARAMFKGSVILVDETSMAGNAQVDKLIRLANLLKVDRIAFVGDKRQLSAIDAGKPFEMMQASGVPTAQMTVNLRSLAPELKAAVYLANIGRPRDALAALEATITEAPGEMSETAAARWLGKPAAERDTTLLMASGRRIRDALNIAVQDGLLKEGSLGTSTITVNVLDRIDLTREEERYASKYPVGARIEFGRGIAAQNIAGGGGIITATDARRNTVEITRADGSKDILRTGKLRPQRAENSVRLGWNSKRALHAGDKIRWTDTDTKRGMLNADLARVSQVRPDGITVELASGITQDLGPGDKMLGRLDLGYAMNTHVLQGTTASKAIAVLDSRETNLTNGRLFLVNVSRVRDGIELIMDSRTKVENALERNPGYKQSALETVGELVNRPDPVMPLRTATPAIGDGGKVPTSGQTAPPTEPKPPTPTPPAPGPEKPNPERDRSRALDFGL